MTIDGLHRLLAESFGGEDGRNAMRGWGYAYLLRTVPGYDGELPPDED